MKQLALFLLFNLVLSFQISGKNTTCSVSAPQDTNILKKKISVSVTNKTIRYTLDYLHSNYSLSFLYVDEQIPWNKNVSLQIKNQPLDAALHKILLGTGLTYFEFDEQIGLVYTSFADTLHSDTILTKKNFESKVEPGSRKNYQKVTFKSLDGRKGPVRKTIYYIKKREKNRSRLYVFSKDSIVTDTVIFQGDTVIRKRNTRISSKQIPDIKPFHHSIRFSIGAGRLHWSRRVNISSLVESLDYESDERKGLASLGLIYEGKILDNIYWSGGLVYQVWRKSGTVVSKKINRFYPGRTITSYHPYDYTFKYLIIPLGFGRYFRAQRFYFFPQLCFDIELPLGTNYSFFPVYKTQYFSSILPGSAGSGEYYDKNNNLIEAQSVPLKGVNSGFFIPLETGFWIGNSIALSIIPTIYFSGNIYKSSAPVKEFPARWDVALAIKYNISSIH